jgi:hypothetical protein
MQRMLFLKPKEDEPIDRIINLDHLATAYRAEDGSTMLIVEGAHISMGMKFEDFLAKVQELIAANYRDSAERSAFWERSRMENLKHVISEAMNLHR